MCRAPDCAPQNIDAVTGHTSPARIKFVRKRCIEQAERARREDGSPQGSRHAVARFTTAAPAGHAKKQPYTSRFPRLGSRSRLCHQWIFRPIVLWVSAFKILLHFHVGATPEIGQILGDLYRPPRRRQKMQRQGLLTLGNPRCF